jgi:hypothetical protein
MESREQKEAIGMEKLKKCESCCYYGRPGDAPETAPEDCMWEPSEEEDWEPPCAESEEENE